MKEIWKDIEGYKGYYQVSNKGRIKSLSRLIKNDKGFYIKKGKILKLGISGTRRKYFHCQLCKKEMIQGSYWQCLNCQRCICQADYDQLKQVGQEDPTCLECGGLLISLPAECEGCKTYFLDSIQLKNRSTCPYCNNNIRLHCGNYLSSLDTQQEKKKLQASQHKTQVQMKDENKND